MTSQLTENAAVGGLGTDGQRGGDASGGGIDLGLADATVLSTTFTRNTAVGGAGGDGGDGRGGGLNAIGADLEIDGGQWRENAAIGGAGGDGAGGAGRGGALALAVTPPAGPP